MKRPKRKPPILLTFHGGGFVQGEPGTMPDAVAAAQQRGFRVREVGYPLGNPNAALKYSNRLAKKLERKGRDVLAYGESAGGALAARLAQMGRVDSAAAWMPPPDLNNMKHQAVRDMIASTGRTPGQLRKVSPAFHKTKNPILAQIARDDALLDPNQQRAWAQRDKKVKAREYAGNHVFPDAPESRATQLGDAMAYLKRQYKREALRDLAVPRKRKRIT